jgi:hypothetical protein
MGTEREEVERIQGTYRQVERGFKGTDMQGGRGGNTMEQRGQ